jgi:hypothetical protein
MSDFFEPPPLPKVEVEEAPREDWMGPPRRVVPAVVPVERVVARTDEVGIYLGCFSVYPAGFEFEIFVTAKDESTDLDPLQFAHHYRAQDTGEIPSGQLRLGFQFADGTKVTNTRNRFDWDGEFGSPPKSAVMSGARGSSGEGQWHHTFWIWPLPPSGPLEFVCEWPAAEIPLTRSELDGAAIIEAAARAQAIFPND